MRSGGAYDFDGSFSAAWREDGEGEEGLVRKNHLVVGSDLSNRHLFIVYLHLLSQCGIKSVCPPFGGRRAGIP